MTGPGLDKNKWSCPTHLKFEFEIPLPLFTVCKHLSHRDTSQFLVLCQQY